MTVWMDTSDDSGPVPTHNGSIFAKVSCIREVPPVQLQYGSMKNEQQQASSNQANFNIDMLDASPMTPPSSAHSASISTKGAPSSSVASAASSSESAIPKIQKPPKA